MRIMLASQEHSMKYRTVSLTFFFFYLYRRQCNGSQSSRHRNHDDDSSSEIRPVMSPTSDHHLTDSFSLKSNGKLCLGNGHADGTRETIEPAKSMPSSDPWILRRDLPASTESMCDYEQQRPKSVQYETRPYYRSLSATSDDYPCQHQHQQQQQQQQQLQPLLNNIDKDIEYVESRLRGQTIVSLPSNHASDYTPDAHWQRLSNRQYKSPLSSSSQPMHAKYSTGTNKPYSNEPVTPTKSSTDKSQVNESVKTVKRRMEKMKDQKAAKTLRSVPPEDFQPTATSLCSSAILIAFIVTWLPYNTNIIISTIKPDIFERGFPMYWERFGYMLCYINSTIK